MADLQTLKKAQRGSWESKCQDVMVVGTASIGTMKLQQSYGQVQGKSEVCFSVHTLLYQAGTTIRGDPPITPRKHLASAFSVASVTNVCDGVNHCLYGLDEVSAHSKP